MGDSGKRRNTWWEVWSVGHMTESLLPAEDHTKQRWVLLPYTVGCETDYFTYLNVAQPSAVRRTVGNSRSIISSSSGSINSSSSSSSSESN